MRSNSNNTPSNPLLTSALGYAELGWHVLPLRPRSKRPLTQHGLDDATTDPATIRRWWGANPQANIGISCGPSRLVAVDLDLKPAADGLETWRALGIDEDGALIGLTPGGGRHLIFRAPAGPAIRNSVGRLGPGIDVRGHGGYIVVPPSFHPNQSRYRWDPEANPFRRAPGPLPTALVERLKRRGRPAGRRGAKTLAEHIRLVAEAPPGTRNDQLNRSAYALGKKVSAGWLKGDQVQAGLLKAALQAGLARHEAEATITSGLTAGMEARRQDDSTQRRRRTTAEYIEVLSQLGYTFRLNEVTDHIEVSGRPITDHLAALIRTQVRDAGLGDRYAMEDAYRAHAYRNRYHPVRTYLASCDVRDEDAIMRLCDHLEDTHGVLTRWLHYWLVGTVAKVFTGSQNRMLVLDGPQGIGKSCLVRWLATPLPGYFIEGPVNPSSKDDLIRLTSCWIWEVAELGATTRKADSEALKHFISMQEVTVRRPYDRYDTVRPAMASLIGTINSEGGFLQDQTGSRRYLIATLERIDWGYCQAISADQIWAVAYRHWQRGEWVQLSPEDARLADEINLGYGIEDPVENMIREHFNLDADEDSFVSSSEIFEVLHDRGIRGSAKAIHMEIANAARRLGIPKVKRNGQRGYLGLSRHPSSRSY